ncbi:EAL and modified HD-GYP domain-containing signal transduction protein [Hydrogenivirga caldilitoris]|uniref:EAL and modified HD-GYP domain-containing signal transduction protein n=1 Tax=Hydrogenivirga caldilitoris TaxID=246264 RepID=A0A497XPZ9_9AQUI|nr:HDOD domain-containing protein [Hydrogenivirga caldilitoris]RLJ70230.1 EAL and modified HD-GYP domain-containing signal transduction protein [Hydrogenivirga caldilitoris]
MSFVIARQPVFNAERSIYGYEVYLRRSDDLEKYPSDIPFNKATFIIAELVAELGLKRVSDNKKVFINVTLDSLLNKVLDLLPTEMVVFQLMPPQIEIGQSLYANAIKRIEELKEKGGLIALTEKLYSGKYADILRMSHIVEFSAQTVDEGRVNAVKRMQKKILISRIESEKEYNKVLGYGDLFEGNYLGSVSLVKEFEIAPFLKSTLMRMIASLNTVQSIREFAGIIASDVGMSAKLLRFVNSAYFARRKEIKDLVQACAYLGMDNLKKFTLLIATNDYVSVENPYLWKKSLIRAILAEEIMKRMKPELANEAYLVGLFSLIDKILGVNKIEFLREVNIDQEIIDAYTGANKPLSLVLQEASILEEALEIGGERLDSIVEKFAPKLRMEPYEVKNLLFQAQSQAEEILRI